MNNSTAARRAKDATGQRISMATALLFYWQQLYLQQEQLLQQQFHEQLKTAIGQSF